MPLSQRSVTESGTEVFDILSSMSELLLRSGGDNLRGVALNMTENHAAAFVAQTDNFVSQLDQRATGMGNSSSSEYVNPRLKSKLDTFFQLS